MLKSAKERLLYTVGEYYRQVILGCCLITVLGVWIVFGLMSRMVKAQTVGLQEGIAGEVIRFHVIANSDSDEDQELKMMVKENVVGYMNDLLREVTTVEETRELILKNLDGIRDKAGQVIEEQGYGYEVTAQLEKCYFPMKSYGDITFPAGEYEALRVCIGKAVGRNWWCVIFPNLCFIDSIHAVVPQEQKEELKNVLTEDEYDSLFSWKDSGDVRITMKVFEFFKQ